MIELNTSNPGITTFKLSNKFKNLSDLAKLRKLYTRKITVRKSVRETIDMDDSKYHLNSSWNSDNEDFYVKSNYDSSIINFQVWEANIEHQRMKVYKNDNKTLLPKDERTGMYNVNVIFFELDSNVFVSILSKTDNIIDQVKSLIDNNNIDISISPLSLINSKIFEWFFWKKNTNSYLFKDKSNPDNYIEINSLLSFQGNSLSGDPADIVKGQSETEVSNLSFSKTSLALKDKLTSAKLSLYCSDAKLCFVYFSSGFVMMDLNNSLLSKNIAGRYDKNALVNPYQKIVYVIGILIPKLISLYQKDSQNFYSNYDSFRIEVAIDLIKEIILKNNLNINDIDI